MSKLGFSILPGPASSGFCRWLFRDRDATWPDPAGRGICGGITFAISLCVLALFGNAKAAGNGTPRYPVRLTSEFELGSFEVGSFEA